jgi:hypothetical protein
MLWFLCFVFIFPNMSESGSPCLLLALKGRNVKPEDGRMGVATAGLCQRITGCEWNCRCQGKEIGDKKVWLTFSPQTPTSWVLERSVLTGKRDPLLKSVQAGHQWLTSVILATWEE